METIKLLWPFVVVGGLASGVLLALVMLSAKQDEEFSASVRSSRATRRRLEGTLRLLDHSDLRSGIVTASPEVEKAMSVDTSARRESRPTHHRLRREILGKLRPRIITIKLPQSAGKTERMVYRG